MIEIGKLAQNISTELFALMTPEEIYNSRKALANSSVGWNPSGSTYPNNLHLQNGLEEELAIVDRWCGGYHPRGMDLGSQGGNGKGPDAGRGSFERTLPST